MSKRIENTNVGFEEKKKALLNLSVAVRQSEQLVCDRCNGSGLDPNNTTLYYKPCQKCS